MSHKNVALEEFVMHSEDCYFIGMLLLVVMSVCMSVWMSYLCIFAPRISAAIFIRANAVNPSAEDLMKHIKLTRKNMSSVAPLYFQTDTGRKVCVRVKSMRGILLKGVCSNIYDQRHWYKFEGYYDLKDGHGRFDVYGPFFNG